ncbi:putative ankyrin repeat domain protein [Rosellinia necatrix]|uniref:Putative ankyrin repeat domain protein n=1 Tax=Rosellinia necatrix TaxID=77044 RepID=A0A1W2TW96_ROSNE|nr:putative ankyrin repeat domain protein [Rosellinia necatrix]
MAQSCNQPSECLRIIRTPPGDGGSTFVNVIALHGLHSTFAKTWHDKGNDGALSPWLARLPFAARIFAYDNPMSFSSKHGLLDQSALAASATALLVEISEKIEVEAERPLVFLCDNMAGVLVKELLWIANHDSRYLKFSLATRAVVFFNTPEILHRLQDDILRLALVSTDSGDRGGPDIRHAEVTEVVNKGPSAVQAATMRFAMIKDQYRIISITEVAPADDKNSYIVQPELNNSKITILMPATHDKLPLRRPMQAALDAILSATQESRKGYQYEAVVCRQKLAAYYEYDGGLHELHARATSDFISPLCEDLISRRSGLVTIYGSAGSGKSVLANQISTAASGVVLSFSFSIADYRRGSYRDLLLSFLLQLLYRDISVFSSSYVQSVSSQMRWDSCLSPADLYRLLCAILTTLPKKTIVCVIDALDECDGESRVQIVGDFKRMLLATSSKCTVFLTCRPSDTMATILGPFHAKNSVNLDGNMKDVRSKLLARELKGDKFQDVRDHLEEENATPLKVTLIAALGQMGELLDIPNDYDSIYKRILARIDAPPMWLETVLLCIAFARRPLTVTELAVAIGVDRCAPEAGGTGLKLQKLRVATSRQLQDDLELIASSIVRIQNNVVQLVHGTLQDFIKHDSGILAHQPAIGIGQKNARSSRALWRSLAILSVPEIRHIKDLVTRSRPFDHLCNVPICQQPYNFARYAGSSLVHDLNFANHKATGELTESVIEAVSQFWDTIETRSWWIHTFTVLAGEANQASGSVPETSLYLAASLGIQPVVKKLLPDVGSSFDTIELALCAAVRCGNVEITRLVLAAGSDFKHDIWRSAIWFSCIYGRAELLASVLQWKWTPESSGEQLSKQELHACLRGIAEYGHWHIIPGLQATYPQLMGAIKRKAIVSLIGVAADDGRDGVISQLIPIVSHKARSNNLSTQTGNSGGRSETAADGIDVSYHSRDSAAMGITMHEVADESRPQDKAEVDLAVKKDVRLGPAIIRAVRFGNGVAVHLLASISRAILEYRQLGTRMTPLHCAAKYGNTEALVDLLDLGADIDAVDYQGATALLFACETPNADVERNINVVKTLLERGADPEYPATKSKYRALHMAALNGQAALVRVLLEAGASENPRLGNSGRETPLHLAVRRSGPRIDDQYVETVRALLDFGADVNVRRRDGSTPLHLAIHHAHLSKNMIKTLRKFGADIDKLDNDGRSSLYYAVSKQQGEVAKLLWDPSNRNKCTVLFHAAADGNADRVRQLLHAGCDRTERDRWGRTARDVAANAEVRSLVALGTSRTEWEGGVDATAMETVDSKGLSLRDIEGSIIHPFWLCDMCNRGMKEEMFYHCHVCFDRLMNREGHDTCTRCFPMSVCKKEEHRVSKRFVAEGLTSYEELCPDIERFGRKVDNEG